MNGHICLLKHLIDEHARLIAHGAAQSDYGQRNSMHIIRYIVTFPPGIITDTTEPNLVHVLYEAMCPFVAASLLTEDPLRSDIIANVNGGSAQVGAGLTVHLHLRCPVLPAKRAVNGCDRCRIRGQTERHWPL